MTRARSFLILTPLLMGLAHAPRSGRIGVLALIERVVLEPNDSLPERIQIWGAFSYADGGFYDTRGISAARRGYMYFTIPEAGPVCFGCLTVRAGPLDKKHIETIRKEWADFKAVAGKGEVVGFGDFAYSGEFAAAVEPHWPLMRIGMTAVVAPPTVAGGRGDLRPRAEFRVRADSEPPSNPAYYGTNTGVVKLPEWSHSEAVTKLREALKRG